MLLQSSVRQPATRFSLQMLIEDRAVFDSSGNLLDLASRLGSTLFQDSARQPFQSSVRQPAPRLLFDNLDLESGSKFLSKIQRALVILSEDKLRQLYPSFCIDNLSYKPCSTTQRQSSAIVPEATSTVLLENKIVHERLVRETLLIRKPAMVLFLQVFGR